MPCDSTPSWPSRLRRLAAFAGEHHHGLANVHDDEAGGIGRRQGALQVSGALDARVRRAVIDRPDLARPALRRSIEHSDETGGQLKVGFRHRAHNSLPVSAARHRGLRQWEYLFCPDRQLATVALGYEQPSPITLNHSER